MANDTIAETVRPKEHRENRKKNRGRKVEDNQAHAVAKFIRVPPRKARLVMDEVRGMYVLEALAFLRFIPNRAAGYISKVLASAVANAANNHDLDPERLKLVEARVDEGPRMKRVQPRAQGRAYRILKRMSHISVIVEEGEPKPKKPAKPTGRRAQAAREARKPATPSASTPVVEAEDTTAALTMDEAATPVGAEVAPEILGAAVETPAVEETTAATETQAETEVAAEETRSAEADTAEDTKPAADSAAAQA